MPSVSSISQQITQVCLQKCYKSDLEEQRARLCSQLEKNLTSMWNEIETGSFLSTKIILFTQLPKLYYELKRAGYFCTLTPFSSINNSPLSSLSFENLAMNDFSTCSFVTLVLPRIRVFGFIPPSPEVYKEKETNQQYHL